MLLEHREGTNFVHEFHSWAILFQVKRVQLFLFFEAFNVFAEFLLVSELLLFTHNLLFLLLLEFLPLLFALKLLMNLNFLELIFEGHSHLALFKLYLLLYFFLCVISSLLWKYRILQNIQIIFFQYLLFGWRLCCLLLVELFSFIREVIPEGDSCCPVFLHPQANFFFHVFQILKFGGTDMF